MHGWHSSTYATGCEISSTRSAMCVLASCPARTPGVLQSPAPVHATATGACPARHTHALLAGSNAAAAASPHSRHASANTCTCRSLASASCEYTATRPSTASTLACCGWCSPVGTRL